MKDKELREAVRKLSTWVGKVYREYSDEIRLEHCYITPNDSLLGRIITLEHIIKKEPHVCKVCGKEIKHGS